MFGKRKNKNELILPPIASKNPDAIEVLRVWAVSGQKQEVTLKTAWKDPAAWGLLLVDVARHVAQAYQREGKDMNETLKIIRQYFDKEWLNPTDTPLDMTDYKNN